MGDMHLHIHQDDLLVRVNQQIGALFTLVKKQGVEIMATMAEIKAQADKALAAIAAESDQDDSIIALVTANTAMIGTLKQQLADAIAAGADPAALQDLMNSFTAAETSALANAAKVNAAVAAGSAA